jgi:hypothetical protein
VRGGVMEFPVPVCLGYDHREAAAYHVACQSILEHATVPVSFIPLALNTLKGYEENHEDGSNLFVYSRFLVPWLMGWKGCAIYMDSDVLVRDDIAKLWALRRHDLGLQVVKHDYKTKHALKYLGTPMESPNEDYPMKNQSSVMLFSCSFLENRKLTPEFVARAPGSFLHRFEWLSPNRVGELPKEWNHLVGEYPPNPDAKLLHHTLGSPALGGSHRDQEGADEWHRTLRNALAPLGGPAAIG